jgi:hypothetical protein
MKFFEILAQAKRGESVSKQRKITRADHKGMKIEVSLSETGRLYDGFYLHKSDSQPARLDGSSLASQSNSIDAWLGHVGDGKSSTHSTFLFPDKMEGPDLMFVLTNGQEQALCVVQVQLPKFVLIEFLC